jgi:hypothetical protein
MFDLIKNLEDRIKKAKASLENAYADGNSDSDYLEGLVDAYEVSLNMVLKSMEDTNA